MLHLSCLRCADSKSNSATRLPRKTTTRVSSGWVASISILLLAIGKSHRDRPACSRRAASAGRADTGPIFGGWDGLEAAGTASGVAPADGERSMNTAEPDELNLELAPRT